MGCRNAEYPTQTNLWEQARSHRIFVLYGSQRESGPFVIAGLGMGTTIIAGLAIGMDATVIAGFAIGMDAMVIPGFIMGAATS